MHYYETLSQFELEPKGHIKYQQPMILFLHYIY